MTELARCRWCGRRLPERKRPGRPREFCRAVCRQQDYLRRQRAHDAGLAEHELVVTRTELDELHDRMYELEAAIEDVERDLPAATTVAEHREALEWLLEAARHVVARRLGDTG
ncbi:MAG: hypothetical protein ACRD0G_20970 [Acidimicrobiales bacterium]